VVSYSYASAAPPAITHLYPAGAQRGTTTDITATGTLDPWPVKVAASGKGVSVVPGKDKGKLAVTVAKDATPGLYWLRAHNDDGVSSLRPFIVGTLPEIAEKEPNDELKKSHAIVGNVVVNGKLEKSGDVDSFAVTLKKGQTLVASMDANDVLKSPMDAVMQIVSTDGFVIEENHDFHGLDPQIAFTAPKDDTYVVRLFAFPSQPDSSIRFFGSEACIYRLTLTTGAFADHAMPLALEKPEDATKAQLAGWNIPKSLQWSAPMMSEDGTHATLLAGEVTNATRVRVEPHPTFALKVPADLKPPFSFTGRIEVAGSEVLIPFEGKKGQPLSLNVESQAFGLAVNPVIRIFDASKKQLASADPGKIGSDTTLAFSPPADGTYTAAVSDLYGNGGSRFVFLLRVVRPEPDYELSVLADRFTLEPGKPTNIPVKVTRKVGFKPPVEVVAEGLPAGVKFEITQPAKPDPNTIVVTLTTEKPVTAPFQIRGKVKDEPRLNRVALAPLPEFESTTADLWMASGLAPPPKKKK